MTPRQKGLIDCHRDLAAFALTKPDTVFVVLDLEDSQGYAIAKELDAMSAEKRQIIAESGSIPAFTLTLAPGKTRLLRPINEQNGAVRA
jgi:hypothetical protein